MVTQWTAAHAHGPMAGVYGMFYNGQLRCMFLKILLKKEFWTPKAEKMD